MVTDAIELEKQFLSMFHEKKEKYAIQRLEEL
jgi:hypothetical protein